MITKEVLAVRLKYLEQAREKAIATVNAYAGAIDDIQYWLKLLEQEEKGEGEPKEEPKE